MANADIGAPARHGLATGGRHDSTKPHDRYRTPGFASFSLLAVGITRL